MEAIGLQNLTLIFLPQWMVVIFWHTATIQDARYVAAQGTTQGNTLPPHLHFFALLVDCCRKIQKNTTMFQDNTLPHILDARYVAATHLDLFFMFAHPKISHTILEAIGLWNLTLFFAQRMPPFDMLPRFRMQGMWPHKVLPKVMHCLLTSIDLFALLVDFL